MYSHTTWPPPCGTPGGGAPRERLTGHLSPSPGSSDPARHAGRTVGAADGGRTDGTAARSADGWASAHLRRRGAD
ncbi:hypothetical protein ACFWWS_35485, partial [Streptomyces sp. NPDC059083]|uniref:hypothetical protein n=1 Tax=Streptomyces sp. NPDC059083 TaxID=3346721 RepID=UPI0036988C35